VKREDAKDRVLAILEYFTGAAGLVGGLLLTTRPDGSSYNQKLWIRDRLKGATYPPS
jgi:hypothetical protein